MKSELSNIVKEHRKKSRLSQAELAKLAGVGKTVVFDIEHGKESIKFNTLLKVLNVLNVRIIFKGPFTNEDKR